MTFGTDWGWGAAEGDARRLFDRYVDRGGNFIDTANNYTNGTSEQLVGKFAQGRRDRLVIATKYSLLARPGDPNSAGNHRKSMIHSVETSLRRLDTDYIDLLYLHIWDGRTPVEEVMRAFDDLVRAGKVLYAGISDTPAWQIARMQTLADLRGFTPLVALQVEYSLVQRTAERDLLPMTSPIIGARTFEQFEDNLGALEVSLTPDHKERLARASAFELGFPHDMLQLDIVKQVMTGGLSIESRA
jgi:aryl-alcohol dehydrogenase-like predicted oxidoreductase